MSDQLLWMALWLLPILHDFYLSIEYISNLKFAYHLKIENKKIECYLCFMIRYLFLNFSVLMNSVVKLLANLFV